MLLVTAIFMFLAVFCGWRFLHRLDTEEALAWAVGFGFCMFVVGGLKVWFWMEMNKNRVLRELKRIELRLAALDERLPPSA